MSNYNVRYDEHVHCPRCNKRWQLLDWACSRHQLTCPAPLVPGAEQERITANAAAHNVTIRWA